MHSSTVDFEPLSAPDKTLLFTVGQTEEILGVTRGLLDDAMYLGGHPSGGLGKQEIQDATRIRLFCEKNGYHFIGNISGIFPDCASVFARTGLFQLHLMIPYGMIIRDGSAWLEVGQLRLGTATKLNREDMRLCYAKYSLDFSLPHFCIDAVQSPIDPRQTSDLEKYETESQEFNQLFNLFLPKDQETKVLSILSPNVMAILIDYFSDCDIEVHGNTPFFINLNADITDIDTLRGIFDISAGLAVVLRPIVPELPAAEAPSTIADYRAA